MQTQFNTRGNGWRGTNPSRQLDGLSQPLTRSLESMDEKELRAQYEKTNTMLNNPNLKLPDGGAKLKAKLEQIKSLLQAQQANEDNITDKVSGLSLNDKPDIRKATVLRSSQAEIHPENLLRAHPTQSSHAGTRMMSLEESMQLQEAQQKDIRLANMRKKIQSIRGSSSTRTSESLADDLSLTMNSLRLDPETRIPRPDDDNPEDMEGEDADSDDDTTDSEDQDQDGMDGFERYDDEGYEEDDQQVFEDGQQHNNNNRRI
ncbi:hypothetical protein V8B55DRAFT_1513965 [Mucor lusitanicus]|nr:hypothetical protein FB192DRAFT_1401164 [Mucor lusitanicus]